MADLAEQQAAVIVAAERVVVNAYGTNPRHSRAFGSGCKNDCIPCGVDKLRERLRALHDVPDDDALIKFITTGQRPDAR